MLFTNWRPPSHGLAGRRFGRPQRRRPTLATRLSLEFLEDRALPSVNPIQGFAGLAFDQSVPADLPDTIVAVGPTQVVEATNPAGLPPASSEWNCLSASSYAWTSAPDAGRCEKTYPSNLFRLWSLASLDVRLEPFHVVADAFRVLARQQTAGKTQQACELVVHLVNDVRAILAF